jgi:hypothetical protein
MSFVNPDPIDRDSARIRTDLHAAPAGESAGRTPTRRSRASKPALFGSAARHMRASWREQVELQERLAVINRPWIADDAR